MSIFVMKWDGFCDNAWDSVSFFEIRIYLAQIGFPLVGDSLYGGSRSFMPRQALHADYIQFTHPRKAEKLSFNLPLPLDIEGVLDLVDSHLDHLIIK